MPPADIPKTMLAWQKHFGSNIPQRVEVPVPSAPSDGLLVRILAAGVCHSDVSLLNMETQPPNFGAKYTLGHEGCGSVVEVGADVRGFAVGDLVAVLSVAGCGADTCPECVRGYTQLCGPGQHYGIGHDGSFAPYVAIRARAAVKVPEGISPEAAAVSTDAVMTAYQAVVRTAQLKSTDTVLIYGLGGLGFNALQISVHIGARVVVVDTRQEVLDEAANFGVNKEHIVPVGADVDEFLRSKNIVVDKVVDFVGVPETFKTGLQVVRMAGTLVLVGLLDPNLALNSYVAVRKQLRILGSYGGTFEDLENCLALIAKGVVSPQVVTGGMADFPQILEDLHAGKVKSRIALIPEGLEK